MQDLWSLVYWGWLLSVGVAGATRRHSSRSDCPSLASGVDMTPGFETAIVSLPKIVVGGCVFPLSYGCVDP